MSFQDDVQDDPAAFRPSTMVVIRDFHGRVQHTIGLPELSACPSDPEWLAMHDAERKGQSK